MSAVLDSTVLIDVLRIREKAVDFLLSLDTRPTCSEITRVEVLQGLRTQERGRADELFEQIHWVPLDEHLARAAGEFGRRFRKSHHLDAADLIVAATAKELGLPLATSNVKHFPMFPRLKQPY